MRRVSLLVVLTMHWIGYRFIIYFYLSQR